MYTVGKETQRALKQEARLEKVLVIPGLVFPREL